jgi:ribonuclease BN (tRNA processing enzyme)
MKVTFLSVGEAFDKDYSNNSHIVKTDKTTILLDCGYSVPQQLWKYSEDPNLLDAINISHHHADHSFGLPAILMRMWEDGRTKDITIMSQTDPILFLDFAYKDYYKKFDKFKINWIKSEEGKEVKFQDLTFNFQKTVHSGENLAIKVTDGKSTVIYGGDGKPKEDTDFYKNPDLIIWEAWFYDIEKNGKSSMVSDIKFAEENNAKALAITHINRDFRREELPAMKDKIKSDKVRVIIPEPLEEYNI